MFSIQSEEVFSPALGHEVHAPVAHRRDRRLGQLLGVGVPLLGQVRLDRHAAAIAVGHGVGVRLDLVDQAQRLHLGDDLLAGLEAVEAAVLLGRLVVQRARTCRRC